MRKAEDVATRRLLQKEMRAMSDVTLGVMAAEMNCKVVFGLIIQHQNFEVFNFPTTGQHLHG